MTMRRSYIRPIEQPDDFSCGPTALKLAAQMLGKKRSLASLIKLCKTNRNGTNNDNMVNAITSLGFPVLVTEHTTLRHLQSALKTQNGVQRAIMVTYLYDLDPKKDYRPVADSGHWAVVSSYSASKGRVVLLDSSTGKKKSYNWQEFREQWNDYDYKRQYLNERGTKFKLIRKWFPQLMMVVAKDVEDLPKFNLRTQKLHYAKSRVTA